VGRRQDANLVFRKGLRDLDRPQILEAASGLSQAELSRAADEAGKLDLDAPVAQYLAELRDMQVATQNSDPKTGKIELTYAPQKRPMTVRDLLRHTAGLVYPPQYLDSPVHRLYRKAVFVRDKTLVDFVKSLAGLPLAHQPEEVWEYSWESWRLSLKCNPVRLSTIS
jgi:CubicO group peptidase (beta-lactamase class C family)